MLLPAGKVAMHFDANSQPSVWQRSDAARPTTPPA